MGVGDDSEERSRSSKKERRQRAEVEIEEHELAAIHLERERESGFLCGLPPLNFPLRVTVMMHNCFASARPRE